LHDGQCAPRQLVEARRSCLCAAAARAEKIPAHVEKAALRAGETELDCLAWFNSRAARKAPRPDAPDLGLGTGKEPIAELPCMRVAVAFQPRHKVQNPLSCTLRQIGRRYLEGLAALARDEGGPLTHQFVDRDAGPA